MHASVRNYFIKFNEPIEKRVSFMYLDIKGLVTIGVGNLIDVEKGSPDKMLAEVKKLPFVYKKEYKNAGQKASVNDIEAEWKDVKKQQELTRGRLSNFENITTLCLDDTAINTLALTKLYAMERELIREPAYKDLQSWPADAQLAILSMAWALGTPKLRLGWPHFRAACQNQNFDNAATHCTIMTMDNPGVIPRNIKNQRLFNNAAAVLANDGKNIARNKIMRTTRHFPGLLMKPMTIRGRRIAV